LYQEAVSICVGKGSDEDKWKKAVYCVFDAPSIEKPYEVEFLNKQHLNFYQERIQFLREQKERGEIPSFVNVIETVECKGSKKWLIWG
jgi:hypothetical protein